MSKTTRAWALAALVILVLPAGVPAAPDDGAPDGAPPIVLWRDKPLRPIPASPLAEASPRVAGTAKVLMLCIEFSDVKHNVAHTPAYFDNMGDGPGNSMAAYFTQASTGVFTVSTNCSGWYSSTQTLAYYGAPAGGSNDNPLLYKLVTEAVYAADASVNFADYDQNNDGWVDYLQVIHAGGDEAMTGNQNDIWSEMYYDFDAPVADGKKVGVYSMVSENDPMGVFAHEYSHQLGMPDLYDTDGAGSGGQTDGAGLWDIMAAGAYLGNGDYPSLPSAWSRAIVGWADVRTITANQNGLQLPSANRGATVLRIDFPGIANEYYLVECRSNAGFDTYLPGAGLLIWHIDNSRGTVNLNNLENTPGKKRVTLEEAHGGTQHLDRSGLKLYDPLDPWSMSSGGFSPTSDPNTTANLDGRHSFISVRNIGPAGATMTCDVVLDTPVYDLRLTPSGTQFNIDPGVATTFSVEMYNYGSLENYTFTVEGKSTEWFTVDPPSIRIGPRNAAGVTVYMRPPVTTPAGTTLDDTFRATPESDRSRYASFKFTVKVNAKQLSVFGPSQDIALMPGETREVNLTVSNRGNLADTVTMTLGGTGTGWVSYAGPMSFSLAAGTNASFTLLASIPFGTEQNARVQVAVGGRSRDGSPSVQATVGLTAPSAPYIIFEGPADVHVKPAVPATVALRLVNYGTADAVLALSTAVDGGWWANLSQSNILIPAWGSEDVPVALTAPAGTPAGLLTSFNLTAAAGAYVNTTSIPVTVDQVFGAALEDCSTSAEVLPGVQHDFRFSVRNIGNGPDDIALDIVDDGSGEGWTAALDRRSARLSAGEAAQLTLSVTSPAGAASGSEWKFQLSALHAGRETTLFDIVSTVGRVRALSLSAGTAARAGDPGDALRFTLAAVNGGNSAESVLFKVPKQEGLSLELDQPDYSFQPGERMELALACKVLAGAAAGVRAFNVTASARDDPSVNATLELRVTVNAFFAGDLQFSFIRQEATAGGTAVFRCTLSNKGNSRDTFTIYKVSGTVDVRFEPASVTLAPGASATVNITVAVPRDDAGGERVFKVAARSQGKSAEVAQRELTVEVPARPPADGGRIAVPLVAAAVVAAAAAAAVLFLRRRKKARSA
jgi:immune inhibitor A